MILQQTLYFGPILFLVEKSDTKKNCLLAWLIVCPQGQKNISAKKSSFLLNDGSELVGISTNNVFGDCDFNQ